MCQCSSSPTHLQLSLVQEPHRRFLEQRKVCTGENRLCLLEGINLSVPGLSPDVEILQHPVALCVQISNVLVSGHELLLRGCQFPALGHNGSLAICQSSRFVCGRLGVSCTL